DLARHRPGPAAARAALAHQRALAAAVRAGGLDHEEALRVEHLALAAAHLAGLAAGARLGAAALAGVARLLALDLDLAGDAVDRLGERQLEVNLQVGAAPLPAAARRAEEVREQIAERGEDVVHPAEAAHVAVEAVRAELVVAGALVRIRQDLVGVRRLLEPLLGVLVARVAIRVVLHGEPPVRLLDLGLARLAPDAEH